MNADIVNKLVQEVHDLLDASSVGLYEFMWILNTPGQHLTVRQREAHARQALDRLLAEPGVKLVKLRWPDSQVIDTADPGALPPDAWADPGEDGLYLAVDRTE